MVIDEKIKQAAKACKDDQFNTGNVNLDATLLLNREWGFFEGANFIKSEMLADMQKLAEALSDMNSWLSRMSELRWDDPPHAPRFKKSFNRNLQALTEFNAKYKGGT